MQPLSIVAIYALFWVICFFVMLPFGLRTSEELGVEKIPGQADSAPANFRPLRVVLRTTVLAAIVFGAFYYNYFNGVVTLDDINLFGHPPKTIGSD